MSASENADYRMAVDKLKRFAHSRNRKADRDPRLITITDDEAVALLDALSANDGTVT